jgi:hypothetical protein
MLFEPFVGHLADALRRSMDAAIERRQKRQPMPGSHGVD